MDAQTNPDTQNSEALRTQFEKLLNAAMPAGHLALASYEPRSEPTHPDWQPEARPNPLASYVDPPL